MHTLFVFVTVVVAFLPTQTHAARNNYGGENFIKRRKNKSNKATGVEERQQKE